jgi:cell wall-associated NlpC family hydrolase
MARLLVVWLGMVAGACATSGATPRPFPIPGLAPAATEPALPAVDPRPDSTTPAAGRYAIAGTALSLRGVPYRNGGNDPSGFDCSGFVWFVFGQHGIPVPRTVGDLYRAGNGPSGQLEPGDLVFFSTTAPGPSHVGIMIGGDEFVHAPSTSGEVRVEHLSTAYWNSRYLGARRVSN